MKSPSNLLNLPGLRSRKQRSGKTFFYLQMLGESRREVALGSDYVQAIFKRREILVLHHAHSTCTINAAEILSLYTLVELPTREDMRAIGDRKSLPHLRAFVQKLSTSIDHKNVDAIRAEYIAFRGQRLALRAHHEFNVLLVAIRWYSKYSTGSN